MTTLRGSTAGAFTSNARTLTLPGGSAAGDVAVVFGYDGFTGPVFSNITGWTYTVFATAQGDVVFGFKTLTAADITAGSVTITWSSSYGGYAALSVMLASSGVQYIRSDISTASGNTGTGRTIPVPVRNGDVALYWAFKRKDGTSPAVSLSRGTSVDISAVTNVGGAYSTEAITSDAFLSLASTVPSAGQADGVIAIVVSDTASTTGVPDDANIYTGSIDPTRDPAWLYKGRATAAADTGSGP